MRKKYLPSIITAILLVLFIVGITILELQNRTTVVYVKNAESTESIESTESTSKALISDISETSEVEAPDDEVTSIIEEESLTQKSEETTETESSLISSGESTAESSEKKSSVTAVEPSVKASSEASDEQSSQNSKEESKTESKAEEKISASSATSEDSLISSVLKPTLSEINITLKVGETKKIYLQNTFDGATWYCDNSAVAGFAAADISGATVEGRAAGYTYIKATINGTSTELICTVTVTN